MCASLPVSGSYEKLVNVPLLAAMASVGLVAIQYTVSLSVQ